MSATDRPVVSAAVVALLSGSVSVVLTVAATLVSLRSDASKAGLFLGLNWIMMVSAGAAIIVLLWVVGDSLRGRVAELHHLRDLDSHVPRRVRIRRRIDRYEIDEVGNATMVVECDVESDLEESVPWMAFPANGAVMKDEHPWSSVKVVELQVDGVDYDAERSFVRRHRRMIEGEPLYRDLILEEGMLRIPISLESGKKKCHVRMVVELPGAFRGILNGDACLVDIQYVTGELEVHVTGKDGFQIFFSPGVAYRIIASQVGGEILDTAESQLQSVNCFRRKGIHWISKNAKVGYHYEIGLIGQKGTESVAE